MSRRRKSGKRYYRSGGIFRGKWERIDCYWGLNRGRKEWKVQGPEWEEIYRLWHDHEDIRLGKHREVA